MRFLWFGERKRDDARNSALPFIDAHRYERMSIQLQARRSLQRAQQNPPHLAYGGPYSDRRIVQACIRGNRCGRNYRSKWLWQ